MGTSLTVRISAVTAEAHPHSVHSEKQGQSNAGTVTVYNSNCCFTYYYFCIANHTSHRSSVDFNLDCIITSSQASDCLYIEDIGVKLFCLFNAK